MKSPRLIAACLLMVLVAGCANGKYACSVPDGVGCRSLSEVYDQALDGTLPRHRAESTAGNTETATASGTMPPDRRAPVVATVQPGDAVLTRPRHIRVWMNRWVDKHGDMHDETYVYLRLDNGKWVLAP